MLVAHNGKVVFESAIGLAERVPQRSLSTDAIFRIASMTKPITSVGIMMLVEDGKLSLNDPVSRFVLELGNSKIFAEDGNHVPAENQITIHHLLTHTSGFVYDDAPGLGNLYQKSIYRKRR